MPKFLLVTKWHPFTPFCEQHLKKSLSKFGPRQNSKCMEFLVTGHFQWVKYTTLTARSEDVFTHIMATNEDIPDFPLLSSMDIPVVLYNLLHSLLSSNSMNGWSIYEAKNGHINVNIRFSSECAVMASDPALPVMPATTQGVTSLQIRIIKGIRSRKHG